MNFHSLPNSPGTQLRSLMLAEQTAFLMEVHDGLSARLATKAGFEALWASGLSMASAMGYRDCNEASSTEVAGCVERIVDNTPLPVLVDADSGFGDFNTARIFARRVAKVGAAGICLEDKLFPKQNSFRGEHQELLSRENFCGRIRAIKDHVPDPSFMLVARTEAMISGQSVIEAVERCMAYVDAGADAVLAHSKSKDSGQVKAFMALWDGRAPVVIVPTTYHSTPTPALEEMGVSAIIWANHGLRASIAAMANVYSQIQETQTIADTEATIANLGELFSLFDYDGLEADTTRYNL